MEIKAKHAQTNNDNMGNYEKYSMSIYHFNLQYMAGSRSAYFKLVKASLQPFLKFFNEFPHWKASLELQGHMIGFLGRHFPEDLSLLQKLNSRGQIELVNVHYSDQIYLAYPYRDMQESCKLNTEIFTKYGLKRSGVFFAQENFFGEGAEKFMYENNYHIALLNQHFYNLHHNEHPFAPYYTYKRVDALIKGSHGFIAPDGSENINVNQVFSYWDDGELAFARGNNYMPGYGPSPEAYQNHIWKYKKLQKKGYQMVSVEDYINRMKELKLTPYKLGPVTDGSWNMPYYGGVYLWMGTYRLPWERDGDIRSLTYQVRNILLSTESTITWCKEHGLKIAAEIYIDLKMAWKHLLLAEVSDSTGQTPVLVEVHYSEKESADCQRYCKKIIQRLAEECKAQTITNFPLNKYIDTKTATISDSNPIYEGKQCCSNFNKPPNDNYKLNTINQQSKTVNADFQPIPISKVSELIGGKINLIRVRKNSVKFSAYMSPLPGEIKEGSHVVLDINWKSLPTYFVNRVMAFFRTDKYKTFTPLYDRNIGNYAGLIFPLHGEQLIYCPALMEDDPKIYNFNEFDSKRFWLPLPNGLIGLGNDVYLIKHNAYGNTHIATTVNLDKQFINGGSTGKTVSLMTLNAPHTKFKWRFSIFKGSIKDAAVLANKINVNPVVQISLEKPCDKRR
jgi:hypothetical protein